MRDDWRVFRRNSVHGGVMKKTRPKNLLLRAARAVDKEDDDGHKRYTHRLNATISTATVTDGDSGVRTFA